MVLGRKFDQALKLAHELHRHQTRKGVGTPYLSHLLTVCALVLENGGGEEEAIAALLHDAVEDQGGQATLDRIREQFGDKVAGIVLECTDKIERTEADNSPENWRARKEADLAKVPGLSPGAFLVVSADKLHNLRSLIMDYRSNGEMVWTRFNGGRDGTLWFSRAMAEALHERRPENSLSKELIENVMLLEDLSKTDNHSP